MRLQDIDVRKTVSAPADVIYRLLDDSSSWPTWTAIESFEPVERAAADGLGEVRAFRTGRVCVQERIVERLPNRRLSYILLSGLAVRDYRADIDLTPEGADTTVRWHTTFKAKLPGLGWAYRRTLLKATQDFVDGLAQRAAQDANARQDRSDAGAANT
jgi:hypothetical protein